MQNHFHHAKSVSISLFNYTIYISISRCQCYCTCRDIRCVRYRPCPCRRPHLHWPPRLACSQWCRRALCERAHRLQRVLTNRASVRCTACTQLLCAGTHQWVKLPKCIQFIFELILAIMISKVCYFKLCWYLLSDMFVISQVYWRIFLWWQVAFLLLKQ